MQNNENISFKKKFENYWFYYKYHTIAGIFAVLVIAISLVQCVQNVNPDFNMVYVSKGYGDMTALETKVSETVGDLNGDGHLKVYCESLAISDKPASEEEIAMMQKFMITFVSGEYRLYIMNSRFFEAADYAECFENLVGILPEDKLAGGIEYDGGIIAIPAESCPYLKDTGIETDNYYVGILRITEASQRIKNIQQLYDASKLLLNEMVK